MAQLSTGLRRVLSVPRIYDLFQTVIGARRFYEEYVSLFVNPFPGAKIIDIGCGTSAILEYLPPSVNYIGFDLSSEYIRLAKARYGSRGKWYCSSVSNMPISEIGTFDIAMANGVLHHLDDQEVLQLAKFAEKSLKPLGRFCSYDGCFTENQSIIARYLISRDRGQNVRTQSAYLSLISSYFPSVHLTIRNDMYRLPYTHAIMTAAKNDNYRTPNK